MNRVPLPLAQAVLSGLNHVLRQQPALRDTMRAHAGRPIRIVVANPLVSASSGHSASVSAGAQTDARIGDDGLLTVVSDATPSVTLTLRPGVRAALNLLREGPAGLGNDIEIEGDVMVAAAIGQVARSLRWDFEEDLSRIVGDSVAHRVGTAFRRLRVRSESVGERSFEAAQRMASGPEGPLLSRAELARHAQSLRELSDRLTRIEARTQ